MSHASKKKAMCQIATLFCAGKKARSNGLQLRSINCADEDSQYAVVRLDAPIDAPVATNQSRDYYFPR